MYVLACRYELDQWWVERIGRVHVGSKQ
jgi:hypothetical protein